MLDDNFPDIQMPRGERRGSDMIKFDRSHLLELEGFADVQQCNALLAPLGLKAAATPSGKARVSIGSMRYNSMGGLSRPGELWFAIVARPLTVDTLGYAYVCSVTDSGFTVFVGTKLWGLRYERGALQMDSQQPSHASISRGAKPYAELLMASTSSLPVREFEQLVDFPVFTPGGKTMQVEMKGPVISRHFDPAHDKADFAAGSIIGTQLQQIGFTPYRWVSHNRAHGALRLVLPTRGPHLPI